MDKTLLAISSSPLPSYSALWLTKLFAQGHLLGSEETGSESPFFPNYYLFILYV